MTCVMCNPWKRTFTLAPLALFTTISPNDANKKKFQSCPF